MSTPTAAGTSPFGNWLSQQASGSLAVTWSCLTADVGCAARQAPVGDTAQDPPGAPSNLAFQLSGSTLILTWSPPGPGPLVTTYIVQAGSGPGLSNIASFNTGSTATSLTVTSVPSGTYFVRVRAANLEGPGAASNEVTIVVGSAPCPPPAAPAGLTGSANGSTVSLQWAAVAGALAYIVEAGSAPGASNLASFDTGSAATSFSATAPNGTYYLRIRVRTACGTSGVSNEVAVTVGGTPPPGGGLTGRWIGLVANGDGLRSGGETWDWQLDLNQTGNTVTGTLTQTDVVPCRDAPACRVQTAPLTGTVSGTTFSFSINTGRGALVGSATFTASRMTGTATGPNGEPGTLALNKQ